MNTDQHRYGRYGFRLSRSSVQSRSAGQKIASQVVLRSPESATASRQRDRANQTGARQS